MFQNINNEFNMVHVCKVQCFTMDSKTAEDLGIEDPGKWLPFTFNMDIIDGAKMTTDEKDAPEYNCTTIYTNTGTTFIIDTPYEEFFKKFKEWNTIQVVFKELPPPDEDLSDDNDLEL